MESNKKILNGKGAKRMAIIYTEGHPCHVLESLYVPNTLNYFVQLNANYVYPVMQVQIFRRCLTSETPNVRN
jgi:hypothetical protein